MTCRPTAAASWMGAKIVSDILLRASQFSGGTPDAAGAPISELATPFTPARAITASEKVRSRQNGILIDAILQNPPPRRQHLRVQREERADFDCVTRPALPVSRHFHPDGAQPSRRLLPLTLEAARDRVLPLPVFQRGKLFGAVSLEKERPVCERDRVEDEPLNLHGVPLLNFGALGGRIERLRLLAG